MALIMHSELNKNVCKTLIAAEYVGVEIKMAENFQMGKSNKTPEFLKMNHLGKVPALETPEGPIFESNAIARYVARLKPENTLFGSSPIEYGQIEQWIDFSALELDANMRAWVFPRLGYATYIKSAEESYISGVKRGLGALNTHLQSRTFLVGYAVTLADIIMTCNLVNGFKYLFTKSFTSEFPHVERYFWTMVNQPKFSKIIKLMGEIKQAEVVLPFPSSSTKPKPEPNPKSKPESEAVTLADIIMTCNLVNGFKFLFTKIFTSEFPHVERYFWTMVNQPKFSKIIKLMGQIKQAEVVLPFPSSSTKPKPEPNPKSKPESEAVDDVEEAAKPKATNPLDLLPPSKMVLDDWKRLYSNTKTNFREIAIKGFWEMFDPEGYSLWFCDYKFNDENTESFVIMNKVGGFLQRMDLARKYAFGKILIIGNEPPFKVKGLWIFRGPDIPKFVMDECYDIVFYEWTKVDLADEAQKERVNQMIEDMEAFEGEALLDAKCFK